MAIPDRLPFATAQGVLAAEHPVVATGDAVSSPIAKPVAAAGNGSLRERSVVFRKDEAEAIAFAQSVGTIHVFGYRDPDDRPAPLRTLENRFASTLDAGSPELVAGRSRRFDCLYIGVLGFSCADPLSSLLVNLRWHLR